MKNSSGKSSKGGGNGKAKTEAKKDRKSGSGLSGSPKKGGHGGKFTWAGDGDSWADMGPQKQPLDARDPNFVDPEDSVSAV